MLSFVKGDTIELEVTANVDITDWKIRAEIYDKDGNSVQIATENSGGSDEQIDITNVTDGIFTMIFAEGLTTNFNNSAYLEIEREDADGKILTIYQGEILLTDEKITWSSPS